MSGEKEMVREREKKVLVKWQKEERMRGGIVE